MENDSKKNNIEPRGSFFRTLTKRPEFGSLVGLIVLWTFFSIAANNNGFNSLIIFKSILDLSVSIGVIAVIATLLLISGEFDISVGSMVGATGVILASCIVVWELPLWLSLIITFGFAIFYGFIQGFIVVKTKIPSLIVTLGGLFFLRGLTYGGAKTLVKRGIISGVNVGLEDNWLFKIFAGKIFNIFPASIIWWIVIVILAYFILKKTRFGNWIFATGGNELAAKALGVPTDRVKIILFMATAAAVAVISSAQTLYLGSADTLRGTLREMEVIITIVIGGTLITGGFGSPFGTFLGCLTLGLLRQGIYMLDVPGEWYQAVLGVVLIIAVLVNRTGQRMEKL